MTAVKLFARYMGEAFVLSAVTGAFVADYAPAFLPLAAIGIALLWYRGGRKFCTAYADAWPKLRK